MSAYGGKFEPTMKKSKIYLRTYLAGLEYPRQIYGDKFEPTIKKKILEHIWQALSTQGFIQSFKEPCFWILEKKTLIHSNLVDSSTLIYWKSPFAIRSNFLGLFGSRQKFLAIAVSKQWRPWSDATLCSFWSGSALFAYLPTTMG